MNLKKTLILGLSLLWSVSAQADGRAIGVRSTRDADFKVHVSISSGVENERKKKITVEQAAGILRDAKGWGSSVWVGIVAHGVPSQDYPPLLEEISNNFWLDLVFVEGRKPDFINDNIKKIIDKTPPTNPLQLWRRKLRVKSKEKPEPESKVRSR